MTIGQFDERAAGDGATELGGVDLYSSEWEVVAANSNLVSFRRVIPKLELEVTKTLRLQKAPQDEIGNATYPAYGLLMEVSVANVGEKPHKVAYRLEGPTGLPIEGAWYAYRISRTWSGAGLRDIVARFVGGSPTQITSIQLSEKDFVQRWTNTPLEYIAVDAQYFAAAMIPQKADPAEEWFAEIQPIRVGEAAEDKRLTNVSFRLDSIAKELAPGGPPLKHSFEVFVGPKRPRLLDHYGPADPGITLNDLVYYGWFGFVARPMVAVLDFFHGLVANYGLAIIMLTIVVRGFMFPLSRKQAASGQKMALIQPEIKRINEKYKNDLEKKSKALQELYRQHNFHPLGGCLPALVQLPIFVGLYSALKVDVELRQAPLFGDGIRWASNLAAPDMLWDWSGVMPKFITEGQGIFALGPYFNLLPIVTVALFIWQQKMFMPPPADEQAALQQKMMQYMMIFVGIMFFKVASGLGVYLICSSLWGIAERKLLGTGKPGTGGGAAAGVPTLPPTDPSGNGASVKKKRQRGRK
jgi:YidC/Oxa1 family membrane protein insertase